MAVIDPSWIRRKSFASLGTLTVVMRFDGGQAETCPLQVKDYRKNGLSVARKGASFTSLSQNIVV